MGETLMIVGAVVGAVASVSQGISSSNAASAQRAQYEQERKMALLAADQDEVARRQALARVLGTQQAMRAGMGVDIYSGTGLALRSSSINQAETDIATNRLNYESKAYSYGLAGDVAGQNANSYLAGGLLSGGAAIASGVGDYYDAKQKATLTKPVG